MDKKTAAQPLQPGRRKALLATATGLALGSIPAGAWAQGAWPTPG